MKQSIFVILIIFSLILYSCRTETPTIVAEISFKKDVRTSIYQSCLYAGCHVSGGVRPLLTSYDDIVKEVSGTDPYQSHLYLSITGKEGHELMPKDHEPLSDIERQNIFQWIKQGAKNN